MFTQKTFRLRVEDRNPQWWVVDAKGQTLGRLATQVAQVLTGKNRPVYTPNVDSGDFVVIINSDEVQVTGKKLEQKTYYRHSGHVGGIKARTLGDQMQRDSTQVILRAVKGMLPKTSLGRKQLTKLKVFSGSTHNHEAQAPKTMEL